MFQGPWTRRLMPTVITVTAFIAATLTFPWLVPNIKLMTKSLSTTMRFSTEEWANLATPHIGENVLPPRIQVALNILRVQKLEDFRLTPSWQVDPLLNQRITEAAYPILHRETSRNVIGRLRELPQNCQFVAAYYMKQEPDYDVAYSRCP